MSPFKSNIGPRTNTMSSIRGKISSPMPVADDDEFPIRTPGTGIALPLGLEGAERQLRIVTPSFPAEDNASPLPTPTLQQQHPPQQQPPQPPNRLAPELPPRNPEYLAPSEHPQPERTENHDSRSTRHSTANSTLRGGDEKPQRRKSAFRATLSKIFGSKKRKAPSIDDHKRRRGSNVGSDNGKLGRLQEEEVDVVPRRGVSMPLNEYSKALRSHSPGTGMAEHSQQDEDADALRNGSITRPRGATLPTYRHEIPDGSGFPGWGLSPRPTSSRMKMRLPSDEEEIGTAITSGSHPNRRSRSLSHLRENALNDKGPSRRRSDEIRYWRQSYDPDTLSPLSSHREHELPFSAAFDKPPVLPVALPAPQPFNFGPIGEMAGMKITQAASLESRISRLESELLNIERTVTTLNDRATGSISRLRSASKDNSASRGKNQLLDDESEVAPVNRGQMYQQPRNSHAENGYVPMSNAYDSQPPTPAHTHSDRSPLSTTKPQSSQSQTPTKSTAAPAESPVSHYPIDLDLGKARPQSKSATIRGLPSSPTRPEGETGYYNPSNYPYSKHGSLTAHHYTALLNLISAETKARTDLEGQVLTLQHQLHAVLGGTLSPLAEEGDHWDSRDPRRERSRKRGSSKKESKDRSSRRNERSNDSAAASTRGPASIGGISAIENMSENSRTASPAMRADEMSATVVSSRRVPPHIVTQTNGRTYRQNDFQVGEPFEDDEVFKTPSEERNGFAAVQEMEQESHDVEMRRQAALRENGHGGNASAARTMSLSQMTLGKGSSSTAVNF